MTYMIMGLERYVKKKGLELNVGKSKIMKFTKERKRRENEMIVER